MLSLHKVLAHLFLISFASASLLDDSEESDCTRENIFTVSELQTNDPTLASNPALRYIYGTFGRKDTLHLRDLVTMLLRIRKEQIDDTDKVLQQSCNIKNMFYNTEWNQSSIITPQDLIDMCPGVLQLLDISANQENAVQYSSDETNAEEIKTLEKWGYGFLSVLVISLCSLGGISVLPIMDKPIYDKVLLGLICLAVGTLSGSAIFQLIPEGLGIESDERTVWRSCTICGGLYMFFFINLFLEIIFGVQHSHNLEELEKSGDEFKNKGKNNLLSNCPESAECSLMTCPEVKIECCPEECCPESDDCCPESVDCNNARMYIRKSSCDNGCVDDAGKTAKLHLNIGCVDDHLTKSAKLHLVNEDSKSKLISSDESSNQSSHHNSFSDVTSNHTSSTCFIFQNYHRIKAIAWLITIADALHNFNDGIAIGASYSVSAGRGLSTSLAIFCEEFPHELGDFAILLSAGMSFKQAVFFNFFSACSCFVGLIIGLSIGNYHSSSGWIFAVAGGVFLYIALAGLLPEAKELVCKRCLRKSPWLCFMIQNLGLLTGFSIMLLLTVFIGPCGGRHNDYYTEF